MSITEDLLRLLSDILVVIIARLLLKYIPERHSLKALVLAVCTVALVVILNLPKDQVVFPPRDQVVVPDVTGLYKDQAAKECRDSGLSPPEDFKWSTKGVEFDKVLEQRPKPGAVEDRGRVIALTISLGPPATSRPEDKTSIPSRTHGIAEAK